MRALDGRGAVITGAVVFELSTRCCSRQRAQA